MEIKIEAILSRRMKGIAIEFKIQNEFAVRKTHGIGGVQCGIGDEAKYRFIGHVVFARVNILHLFILFVKINRRISA